MNRRGLIHLALEEVGAAKTHQPLAGSAQVLDELAFGGRGSLFGHRVQVIAQAVARNIKRVDRVDDGAGVQLREAVLRVRLVHSELQR